MPGVCTIGDYALTENHQHPGQPMFPALLGMAASASANVLINGKPALTLGDNGIHPVDCGGSGLFRVVAATMRNVLVNNRPIVVAGDLTEHCCLTWGRMITGSATVHIGDNYSPELIEPGDARYVSLEELQEKVGDMAGDLYQSDMAERPEDFEAPPGECPEPERGWGHDLLEKMGKLPVVGTAAEGVNALTYFSEALGQYAGGGRENAARSVEHGIESSAGAGGALLGGKVTEKIPIVGEAKRQAVKYVGEQAGSEAAKAVLGGEDGGGCEE